MSSRITVVTVVVSVAISSVLYVSGRAQNNALPVMKTASECNEKSGTYVSATTIIGSDGQTHPITLRAAGNTSRILGAYVKTGRTKYDNGGLPYECPLNAPAGTRCRGVARAMSVETCGVTPGVTADLNCRFTNAGAGNAGAENPKVVEIWACFGK